MTPTSGCIGTALCLPFPDPLTPQVLGRPLRRHEAPTQVQHQTKPGDKDLPANRRLGAHELLEGRPARPRLRDRRPHWLLQERLRLRQDHQHQERLPLRLRPLGGESVVESPSTPYSPSLRSTRKHARQPAPARRRPRRRVCPPPARPRGGSRPHRRGSTRTSTSSGRVSPPMAGLAPRSLSSDHRTRPLYSTPNRAPELQNIPRGTPQSVPSFLAASPPRLAPT
jgi:hypothetical protein